MRLSRSLSLSLILMALGAAPAAQGAVVSFAEVRASYVSSETVFLDRDGKPLHRLRQDGRTRRLGWTPLAAVSPAVVQAVVQAEDRRFRSHHGVDWLALARAAWESGFGLRSGAKRGASTITMQLASFLEARSPLAGRRGAWAKLKQVMAARELERAWSKDEILEAYLNLANFRGEFVGVGTASRAYFGRSPDALSPTEAAVLAALLRAPGASKAQVEVRTARLMTSLGQTPVRIEEALAALNAPARLVPEEEEAPHAARRLLVPGKMTIATTLDRTLQRELNEVLREQGRILRDHGAGDAAALVVENATGQVWAYVGGLGAMGSGAWVDGVQARRQAGSTLKPFLYGMAITRKLITAGTWLDDSPAEFPVSGGMYRPKNYDDQFRGPVRAADALPSSLNVPAVRVLDRVGIGAGVDGLRTMGIAGLGAPELYGHSLALGSADVTLWELVSAYASLSQGGRPVPLTFQTRSTAPLEAEPANSARPLTPEASWIIANLLSDPARRAMGFGLGSPLSVPGWAAVKTGTSKDMRDNWCVGFNSRFTVGVWVGNFSGQPMHDVSGVSGAAPAWARIITSLMRRFPSHAPARPAGVVLAEGLPYLRGTEPSMSVPLADAHTIPPVARILYPTDGELIAIDPDIPDDRQRLPLEWEGRAGLRMELDGHPVEGAMIRLPNRGAHTLALRDSGGRTYDQVGIEIR